MVNKVDEKKFDKQMTKAIQNKDLAKLQDMLDLTNEDINSISISLEQQVGNQFKKYYINLR